MNKEIQPYFSDGKPNPCFNCGYCWYDEREGYETCHYPYDDNDAPCNYDEEGNKYV